MLIIRDEQIAAMTQPARERYREVVRQRLLRAHPDECTLMTHEELGAMISAAQLKGAAYGLKTDEQLYQLIESTLLLGDDFDESDAYPWAADLLGDELRDPTIKAAKLREKTEQVIAEYMASVDAALLAEPEDDDLEPNEIAAARDATDDFRTEPTDG
jgi:hypothetical protein